MARNSRSKKVFIVLSMWRRRSRKFAWWQSCSIQLRANAGRTAQKYQNEHSNSGTRCVGLGQWRRDLNKWRVSCIPWSIQRTKLHFTNLSTITRLHLCPAESNFPTARPAWLAGRDRPKATAKLGAFPHWRAWRICDGTKGVRFGLAIQCWHKTSEQHLVDISGDRKYLMIDDVSSAKVSGQILAGNKYLPVTVVL